MTTTPSRSSSQPASDDTDFYTGFEESWRLDEVVDLDGGDDDVEHDYDDEDDEDDEDDNEDEDDDWQ